MKRTLGIVIITYLTDDLLAELLSELVSRADTVTEVIVVDNAMQASTRNLVEKWSRVAPQPVRYLNLPNPGYGAAANHGISALRISEVTVLCNADLKFGDTALEALTNELLRDQAVAIVGPVFTDAQGNEDSTMDPMFPHFGLLLITLAHLHNTPLRHILERFRSMRGPRPTEWLSGAVMALRVEDWKNGLRFDERYFMYMEDVDLCRQAAIQGRGVSICRSAYVMHVGGASSPRISKRVYVHSRLAKLIYAEKWTPQLVKPMRLLFSAEALFKATWRDRRSEGPRLWLTLRADIARGVLVDVQYDPRVVER